MLITPKSARDLLADLTQTCAVPVDADVLTKAPRGRFAAHGYILIGDAPVRGYKHKGQWRFDDREIRRAGQALEELKFDRADLVDAGLFKRRRQVEDTWDPYDWRRVVHGWMSHAAFNQVYRNGCPCGDTCQRRQMLKDDGLPCGLTMAQFTQEYGRQTIACTRPLDVLHWADREWRVPRAYAHLLDRWAKAEEHLAAKARSCTGCGKPGDAWEWRTPSVSGWITLCPSCTAASSQTYSGQLRGAPYDSVPRTTRADSYLCQLCTEPRHASHWDHCHDHGYVRGPLCASCNTYEGLGLNFLTREGGLAHLLECRGCREQRTLPQRHHENVARSHLYTFERHGRCRKRPYIAEATRGTDGAMRFRLVCHGHGQQKQWERELSGVEVMELVREFVDKGLAPA
ncbi:endonuclease domain-containing protein [Streptomyces sp. NPDC004647]|uniref:endonuclease domain-containing protein n=1 Tax=Streptomyces sp. NPDC004647 TaxID=3154671 RepID=UPI0033A514EF